MKPSDPFRPTRQPAQAIYDALVAEAALRSGREMEKWMRAEREAVWRAARDYAQQHGLQAPTLEMVHKREALAVGHVDFASKWAYAVAELLVGPAASCR